MPAKNKQQAEIEERGKFYWSHGKGADLIGWGTPGDFERCVKLAGKHIPKTMIKGYCAERHHEATGYWPGHAPSEQTGKH